MFGYSVSFRFGMHALGVLCIEDTPASISSFYYEVLEWSYRTLWSWGGFGLHFCSVLVGGRFVCAFLQFVYMFYALFVMVGGDLIR